MPIQLAALDARNLAKVYKSDQSYTDPSDIAMMDAINLLVDAASSSGTIINAFSIANLAALDASLFPAGTLVYVTTLRSYFFLDKISGLTADNITIVDALNAGASARWMRLPVSSPYWSSVAVSSWFIDASIGNDQNPGTSPGDPIQTLAELWRRLGYGAQVIIKQPTTFTLTGTFGVADPLKLNVRLIGTAYLSFVGTPGVTSSGIISAKTDLSRPTLANITGSAGIAAFVGQWCLITAGANAGTSFWLERDMGANQIETSPPIASMTVPNTGIPTFSTTAIADSYSTFGFARLDAVNLKVCVDDPAGPANFNAVYFNQLDLLFGINNALAPAIEVFGSSTQVVVENCSVGGALGTPSAPGTLIWVNCRMRSSANIFCGSHFVFAGMTLGTGTVTYQNTAWVLYDFDHLMSGGTRLRSRRKAAVNIGTLCIQNSASSGFTIEPDACDTRNSTNFAGAHLLYGTGNTTVGIQVGSARSFFYTATKPTITGGAGNTNIGSAAVTAYAAIPFVFFTATPDNGAQITVTYP